MNPETPTDVESLLASFAPIPSRVNRDRVLFAAGEQAGRRAAGRAASLRLWQGLTAALAVATCVLSWRVANPPTRSDPLDALATTPISVPVDDVANDADAPPADRPAPRETVAEPDEPQRPPAVPRPIAPRPVPEERERFVLAPGNYVSLRNAVLTHGVDALPRPAAVGGASAGDPPMTYGQFRRALAEGAPL